MKLIFGVPNYNNVRFTHARALLSSQLLDEESKNIFLTTSNIILHKIKVSKRETMESKNSFQFAVIVGKTFWETFHFQLYNFYL